MKIPLFDLDGTLLQNGGLSKILGDAYDAAFGQIYDLPQVHLAQEIHPNGLIHTQLIVSIAEKYGYSLENAVAKLPQATQVIIDYFLTHKHDDHYVAHTGAKQLLEKLQELGIRSGVLTGNVEQIAWEKLEKAGLKEYIEFGSFGNMAMKRVDLIPIAQKAYQERFGEKPPITDFVIVGDTPRDIACAQEGGIPVIAVPTGSSTKAELAKEMPTLLVDTLNDLKPILSFLQS